MSGTVNILAEDHLFEINDKPKILDEYTKKYFHMMTDKLPFISKRSRNYLQ